MTRNLGSGAGHDPTGTWTNTYDDAGHLLTETLPWVLDPATGQLAQPTVLHTWDWLDDETQRTDVRGKTWTYFYDALRRLTRTTSPSGLVTDTEYRLRTGTAYDHKVTTWTPPGVSGGVPTVSTRDVLGRQTQLKTGTLDATTYTYDGLDRLTQVTDPASVVTPLYPGGPRNPNTGAPWFGSEPMGRWGKMVVRVLFVAAMACFAYRTVVAVPPPAPTRPAPERP